MSAIMSFHDGKFRNVEYERFKEWHRVTTSNAFDGSLINVFHTKERDLALKIYDFIIRQYGSL